MTKSSTYAAAAFLSAAGLLASAHAMSPWPILMSTAQAQSTGGGASGSPGAGSVGAGTTGGATIGGVGSPTGGPGSTGGRADAGGTTETAIGTGATGTVQPGALPQLGTHSGSQPGNLNQTQPSAGVNPYPGTSVGGGASPTGTGQANPALNTPRAGEVPAAPGTGVNRFGQPCNMSGTAAPNANLPSC